MGPLHEQEHGRPPEQQGGEQTNGTSGGGSHPTPHDALLAELRQHSSSAAAAGASHDDRTTKQEFSMLFKLAGPTIVQTASQQAMVFTDQIFLGHLGTEQMAAAALGNMYVAFLTFFLLGTATALDTLGSQAYGAQRRGVKGGTSLVTWCFTGFVVLTLLCIPVTVLMSLGYPVARALLGQGPEIAKLMEEFCAGLIPGIWPMMWSVVLMKYLQVQNIVAGPAMVAAATFVLNIGSNFVFIAALGFQGAALATSFSRLVQFAALCVMVHFFERTRTSARPPGRFARWLFQGVDSGDDHLLAPFAPSSSAPSPSANSLPAPDAAHDGTAGARAEGNSAAGPGRPQGRPSGMVRSDSALNTHQQDQDAAPASFDEEAVLRLDEAGGRAGSGRVDGVVDVRVHDGGGEAAPQGGGLSVAGGVEGVKRRLLRQSTSAKELANYLWVESKASVHPSLLWTYLKLGLPGGVMMACEQGSFDVTTAMAGHLGPSIVAAHSAMINVIGLTFVSCPFAVGIAGSIRVGNLLGLHMPRTARKSGWLAVAIGGTFMAVCAVVLLSTRDVIGRVFTSDMEVVAIIATIAPMGALFQVSDGLMGCSQGVLRGCGKQRLLMVYNIVGFWLCGVLLGYLLCFHAGLGVTGLWWGIASGDTTACILNIVTLALVNWQREAHLAQKNLTAHDTDASGKPDAAQRGGGAGDDDDDGGEREGLLPNGDGHQRSDAPPHQHAHADVPNGGAGMAHDGSSLGSAAQAAAPSDRGVWAPRSLPSHAPPPYSSIVVQATGVDRSAGSWGERDRTQDAASERTTLLAAPPATPPPQPPAANAPSAASSVAARSFVGEGGGGSGAPAAPQQGGRLKSALHFQDMW